MIRKVGYFAGAALAVTLGFVVLAQGQGRIDARTADEMRAVTIARALAWTMGESLLRDDADDLAQDFAMRAKKEVEGLDRALVLKGTKFVVHTEEGKQNSRLDRDSLSDKALYDTAAALKATVRKNVEERERNPALKFDAYSAVDLRRADDLLVVRVPVKVEGEYEALASVAVKSAPPPVHLPLGRLFLFALGAVLLFAALAWKIEGVPAFVAGSLLVLAMVAGHADTLAKWRDGVRLETAKRDAVTMGALARAGLFDGATADGRRAVLASLDETKKGAPQERLLSVRSATVATTVTGIDHESTGFVTTYAPAYFEAERGRDAGYLLQWSLAFGVLGLLLFNLGLAGQLFRGWRAFVQHRSAYAYMAPAAVGMMVLVFIPVAYGLILGFMQRRYGEWEFCGLANFIAILSDTNYSDPTNFYFTLGVTILWTFANVVLHVSIGLFFALLLNDQMLKARGIFRVLLIVPWAVPNYITALIWKGMFHRQFGAINLALASIGIEPISWFQSFWPSFTADVATNTWLGFPFMMVVSLGALQSIPSDLYEAAIVDGASRWQRFKSITLPLLMPALVPAVIMGTVWTFNMFNIIYLVSGGAPNGATDILIVDAFRWAFERDRYGYAAAYSTVIFVILLVFTTVTNRITGATKGAFE